MSPSFPLSSFSGSLVAIVTPMHPDGTVDYSAWSRLVDFHLQNGTSGIVVGGTTGESVTITDDELKELAIRANKHADGRIPIIVGAGTSSTAATVDRARRLSELPIHGLLVVTPSYNRPQQEGLYQHFAAVAKASRLPIIAYNVPSRTAVDMLPETVGRLSQLPRLVAIKEAVPKMERIRELCSACKEGFTILSGDDATAREAVLNGAKGVISVTANVAPRLMADVIEAAAAGVADRAAEIDGRLAKLHESLFVETNPIPVKWALARMGFIQAGIRLPLTELSETHHAALTDILREAALLN